MENLIVLQIVKFFEIVQFQKFDDLRNCKFWEICGIFQIDNISNFPNRKLVEFSKLIIFQIFRIGNLWNFPNWRYFKFSKSEICGIFQIDNISNFPNRKFVEFSKLTIFQIFQIGNLWNIPNWQYFKFSKSEILWNLEVATNWDGVTNW